MANKTFNTCPKCGGKVPAPERSTGANGPVESAGRGMHILNPENVSDKELDALKVYLRRAPASDRLAEFIGWISEGLHYGHEILVVVGEVTDDS